MKPVTLAAGRAAPATLSRRAFLNRSVAMTAAAATAPWAIGCRENVRPVNRGDIPTVGSDRLVVNNLMRTVASYGAHISPNRIAAHSTPQDSTGQSAGYNAWVNVDEGYTAVAGEADFTMQALDVILAGAFGLQQLNGFGQLDAVVPHPEGTNVFGGMTLVGSQLVTATSFLDGFEAGPGQINIINVANLEAQGVVDLNMGINPTGVAYLPEKNLILTLLSGSFADPKAALALVSLDGTVQRDIQIPGSLVGQLSPNLVVSADESYAVIGTVDGSGRLFKIDLNTGDVREFNVTPEGEFQFHSGLAFYNGMLFVASHHEGGVYVIDPSTMEATGFLPVGNYMGPLSASAEGVFAVSEGAFQLIQAA